MPGLRVCFLGATVFTAALLTLLTELLSLGHILSFYPLLISWVVLTIGALGQAIRINAFQRPSSIYWQDWSLSEKLNLTIIITLGILTVITVSCSSPNTWDAMTYHLPRVMHWVQNKTVAFYPTHIIRQLCYAPWTEFAMANLWILSKGQISPSLVQWMAMAGSLVGISLIARQLGADRLGQLMAASITACLPMGILQAVSTQTDYVCAFWLIVFVYFFIEYQIQQRLIMLLATGMSLGLAILTKGNSYILLLPFLLGFLISQKKNLGRALLAVMALILCVALINGGQYWREMKTFGSPVWTNISVVNDAFDLKVLWVNLLRNVSIHMATPFVPLNGIMQQFFGNAAQFLGADINDPRASFSNNFTIHSLNFDEDYSGNFFTCNFILNRYYQCMFFYRTA